MKKNEYWPVTEEERKQKLTVFIVDNQSLYRQAIRQVLQEALEVVGESDLVLNVWDTIEGFTPDIVLVDVGLPAMNGFDITRQITTHCPGVAVVMLSPSPDDEQLFQAIKSGAVDPKGISSYWLRLRIANCGKSVAKRCVGKLTRITDDSGNDVTDYDPVSLLWVGTKLEEIPLSPIDLNPGDYEYLNVFHTQEDMSNDAIICRDILPRGTIVSLKPGRYILSITIYGDNASPKTEHYRLTWGGSNITDIKMEPI
ncbi:response regulator transcription factor [Chloroflexota bacterium]